MIVLDVQASADAFAAVGLVPDSAEIVLMNPPFNDSTRHRASPDKVREIAHMASATTLESWIHAARRVLKPKGMLTLIWRADDIAEVLAALERGFGSIEILPVHVDVRSPAMRILVRATKGGRAPTRIHAAVLLNDESGVPNKQVHEILAGKGILPLPILRGDLVAGLGWVSTCAEALLGKRFRPPFRRRSKMNRCQNGTDQRYQQVDLHVVLRCAVAAPTAALQKAFQPLQ